jgi:2-methylcitrate dehydratase PrpD
LLTYILGWEVTARVGLAARGSFHKRGFHTTSVAGVYGAATAAAKLLELDAEQSSHAFGLAGSQVSGISEYLSNGSSSKSFHPGWAAALGIVAAHLAKSGMTGPMTVFEGRYGLFKTYGIEAESDLERLTRGLGSDWEVQRVSIKPYPCCHFAHAFIDCALALRARGISAANVESLEAVVPEIELPLICEPFVQKLVPDSPYAAKFSLPFLVAAAHIDGRIDHQTFAPEQIRRRDLLAFAQRVSYRVAKPGETTFPKYFPGLITATLNGGRSVEERLDVNTGNPDNPLSLERVEDKFRTNARTVIPVAHAERLIDTVRNLDRREAADLARFLALHSD